MKEKLEENALELLDFVKQSKDFGIEQAPLYVQELVEFHFFDNAFSVIVGVFLITITIVISFFLYRWGAKNKWEDDQHIFIPMILITTLSTLSLCATGQISYSLKECYKAKHTPRVLIIEKLRGQ